MSTDNGFGEFDVADEPITSAALPITGSPLESLREAMKKKIEKEPITLRVPQRPNVAITFDTNLDIALLNRWSRSSQKAGDLAMLNFSTLVLANQMRGMNYGGEEVLTQEGHRITFTSPLLKEFLGMPDTATRIEVFRTLYGLDGHINATANQIVTEAGFGEVDLEDENPTK